MWMNTQIVALNTTAQTYYTPWFPKGSDNGIFTMEKLLDTINGGITVSVVHKNREDEGSAPATAATFASLAGNFYEAPCEGLKEMVRFKITFTASAAGQGAIFRFLAPTWYDTAV